MLQALVKKIDLVDLFMIILIILVVTPIQSFKFQAIKHIIINLVIRVRMIKKKHQNKMIIKNNIKKIKLVILRKQRQINKKILITLHFMLKKRTII